MHFPLSFCKNASPTFSMVHLLHRLYGVDAPERGSNLRHFSYSGKICHNTLIVGGYGFFSADYHASNPKGEPLWAHFEGGVTLHTPTYV